MSRIFYGIAILFLVAWAIGFFLYGLGLIIHLLLVAAVIAIAIKLFKEN
ncbi:lmo0937 family membrane protein [Aureibaculum algae]|uniref:Lmo0937 family membrane protein n=1 Tax=Aureibaculum algae TaxID=2584122 RepID=A0A5B7TUU0_9FLAO|nr:lmo0937 family membrane protein [Aureibaculum algae]QCX39091.1 lmo0937 family membrane protein [Aureibaculum algae]